MDLVRSLPATAFCAISFIMLAQSPAHPNQPSSESVAKLIGVKSEISQLEKLSGSAALADRWQILWLHQHISEQVMAASLQVDATNAQIDNEIARANELRGYLADRRDRIVSRDNLLSSLIGGSIGATSSGLQLSTGLDKPAAAVGIAAGTFSTAFALAGIHAQAGKSARFDFQSNMLAELFDRPTLPNSEYPSTVWAFLNEPALGAPRTRRQDLLQGWVQVQRIDSLASTEKVNHLTSQPAVRAYEAQHRRLRRPRRYASRRSGQNLISQARSGRAAGIAAACSRWTVATQVPNCRRT